MKTKLDMKRLRCIKRAINIIYISKYSTDNCFVKAEPKA